MNNFMEYLHKTKKFNLFDYLQLNGLHYIGFRICEL